LPVVPDGPSARKRRSEARDVIRELRNKLQGVFSTLENSAKNPL